MGNAGSWALGLLPAPSRFAAVITPYDDGVSPTCQLTQLLCLGVLGDGRQRQVHQLGPDWACDLAAWMFEVEFIMAFLWMALCHVADRLHRFVQYVTETKRCLSSLNAKPDRLQATLHRMDAGVAKLESRTAFLSWPGKLSQGWAWCVRQCTSCSL